MRYPRLKELKALDWYRVFKFFPRHTIDRLSYLRYTGLLPSRLIYFSDILIRPRFEGLDGVSTGYLCLGELSLASFAGPSNQRSFAQGNYYTLIRLVSPSLGFRLAIQTPVYRSAILSSAERIIILSFNPVNLSFRDITRNSYTLLRRPKLANTSRTTVARRAKPILVRSSAGG